MYKKYSQHLKINVLLIVHIHPISAYSFTPCWSVLTFRMYCPFQKPNQDDPIIKAYSAIPPPILPDSQRRCWLFPVLGRNLNVFTTLEMKIYICKFLINFSFSSIQ